MKLETKKSIRALSVLLGVVFGAGMFGVPYAIAKAGWVLGIIYFLLLGLTISLIHLMYGEVNLRSQENHRLPGFVSKFIGPKYGNFIKFASTIGLWGSLIAYMIIGGKFLFLILSPFLSGTETIYKFIFWLISFVIIYGGIKILSKIELILTSILVLSLILISALALGKINLNLIPIQVENFFLPYGVIIFSIFGATAIPETKEILSGQLDKMKKIIIWGSVITISLTMFFAFATLGISGTAVHEDAISSFLPVLGPWVLYLGSIIGFLATFTSFLVVGIYLKNQFIFDFKKKKNSAIFWAIGAPLIILMLIEPSFIQILGLAGAIFGAIDSVFLIIVWQKAKLKGDRKPEYEIKIKNWLSFLIIGLFLIGALYEIKSLLF